MEVNRFSRIVAGYGLAIFLLVPATAFSAADTGQTPVSLVHSVTDKMLAALRSQRKLIKEHPDQLVLLMKQIIAPHFDVELMAREVLGKYWRQADAAQRNRFVAAFKQLLLDDYANLFQKYTNQTVEYLPAHPGASRDWVLVDTYINRPGEQRIRVDYHLHRVGTGWRIYDVNADGISLLLTYRDSFSEQLEREGLDALVAHLERKNASFHLEEGG